MKAFFEISELSCSYGEKIVLRIDELTIPKGEMVFIVGQSGCGKSTILEALGLMNDTIVKNEKTVFNLYVGDDKVDVTSIWNKDNGILSDIRLKHFSFIFQQTNLMKNFNIYENIAIAKMLQGASERECMVAVSDILKTVGLESFFVMENGEWSANSKVYGNPGAASGGQQQRMAFARAMVSDYDILFCDEPTGNLDPATADNLMRYLSEEIARKKDVTSIIVSHDLPMALKYGHRVIKIFIEKSDSGDYGLINAQSVFVKDANGVWGKNNQEFDNQSIIEILKRSHA